VPKNIARNKNAIFPDTELWYYITLGDRVTTAGVPTGQTFVKDVKWVCKCI